MDLTNRTDEELQQMLKDLDDISSIDDGRKYLHIHSELINRILTRIK